VKGIPYTDLTTSMIETLEATVFSPPVLGKMLADRLKELAEAPEAAKAEIAALTAEVKRLDGALGRLLDAIEAGGDAKSLAARVNETQRQRDTVAAKLEHASGQQIEADGFDLELWLTESAKLLAGARNFLETDPEGGRRVLRTALSKGLTVRPDPIEGGWVFEGVGQFSESGLRAVIEGRVTTPTHDPLKLVPPG